MGSVPARQGAAGEGVQAGDGGAWPDPRRAWYTISLIAFVTLLANIDRNVINLLVEPIKQDLHLTDFGVSLLTGMAFSIFYLLTGYPVSRISDMHSRKWVIGIGLFFWSLATMLSGIARTFTQMFAARAVVGSAEAMPGPAALSMMSDLVPPNRLPRAFAVYTFGISAGQALALIVGGWLLAWFLTMGENGNVAVPLLGTLRAWHLVFITLGLPGLLTVAVWLLTVREPVRRGRERKGHVPFREFLGYMRAHWRIFVPMFLSIALGAIELNGFITFRIPMFHRTYGWSTAMAGQVFGSISLLTMPFSLIGGTLLAEYLIKRRDPGAMLRINVIGNLCYLPFAVLAPLMPDPWLSFGMLFVGMMVLGISAPAVNAAIQFVAPNEMRGQVSALYLITISVVGTWFGPMIVGAISTFILKDEALLRYGMSGFAAVLGPFTIGLMWLALKPFAAEVRRRGVI